ncbi:hypothetical protein [Actinopolymorpha sp. B9G3]|uniref:hypothetical protein n=1 Tax=Actinopolymorpha sp. B9G3 TaxID=3158970 RepID=UPI0032D9001C
MKVEFHRDGDTQYSVHVHRRDGVVVSLPGAGGRWQVPHDLAHFATERALDMAGGVFGSMAAGAMFERMTVVSGRQRRDPKQRSQQVLRTNTRSRSITVAETMTSLVHDAVHHGRSNDLIKRAHGLWGTVREDAFPYTVQHFQTAIRDLRALSEEWATTSAGSCLAVEWPDRLTTQLPAKPRPERR